MSNLLQHPEFGEIRVEKYGVAMVIWGIIHRNYVNDPVWCDLYNCLRSGSRVLHQKRQRME